ncbi:MAG: hypothetical protein IJ519_00630 [Clostridia bacterium]|nr:hypothetical protein [Clostridia bacterium]
MKKFLALMLSLVLVVCAFASCGETTQIDNTENNNQGNVNNGGNNNTDVEESYDLEGTWTTTMTLYDLNPGFTDIEKPEADSGSTESTDATDATDATTATDATEPTEPEANPTVDLISTITKLADETTVDCTLTFTGDKYTLVMNESDFNNAVKAMGDICVAYLLVANPEYATAEEFFTANKTTEADFRANVTSAMGSPTESGTWTLKDGKLTLNKTEFYLEVEDESNFNIHNGDVYYYYTKG